MERRKFLGGFGLAWLVHSLPIALAACTTTDEQVRSPQQPAATKFQVVGTISKLDQAGYLTNENSAAGPVIVIRNPANPKAITALNPTCPHKGCLVKWQPDAKTFVCPCHDSKFRPDGTVIEGPATQPLKPYQVKLQSNDILIKPA